MCLDFTCTDSDIRIRERSDLIVSTLTCTDSDIRIRERPDLIVSKLYLYRQ
jgi:hypothetical protein